MSWGDPDIEGIWPSTEYVSVPLQRPQQFGTRTVLTDVEVAQRAKQEAAQKEGFERDGAGGATGAPGGCHEGNYGLFNALSGSRASEREAR